jgi:hypothetical protein
VRPLTDFFYILNMKIYLFTVRYRQTFDNDWQFKNVVISDSANLKSALYELRKQFSDGTKFIIDNTYSEEDKL